MKTELKVFDFKISVTGLLCSIALGILIFNVYYRIVYPWLEIRYEQDVWNTINYSYRIKSPCQINDTSLSKESNLILTLHVPKTLADFIEQPINLKIQNPTGCQQRGTVIVQSEVHNSEDPSAEGQGEVSILSNEGRVNYINFLIPPYSSELYTFNVKTSQIKEQSFVVIHVDWLGEGDNVPTSLNWDKNISCYYSEDKNFEDKRNFICLRIDSATTFLHTAIEKLLLSPWSNGVLLLTVLLVIVLLEDLLYSKSSQSKKTPDPFSVFVFIHLFINGLLFFGLVGFCFWAFMTKNQNIGFLGIFLLILWIILILESEWALPKVWSVLRKFGISSSETKWNKEMDKIASKKIFHRKNNIKKNDHLHKIQIAKSDLLDENQNQKGPLTQIEQKFQSGNINSEEHQEPLDSKENSPSIQLGKIATTEQNSRTSDTRPNEKAGTNKCPECGTIIDYKDKFCKNCGHTLIIFDD